MKRDSNQIIVLDTTCRDGMHAMAHSFTADQVGQIAAGLEAAGADIMEVTHGDGMGGSSIIYGKAVASDEERLRAAKAQLKKTRLSILFVPGIAVIDDMLLAADCGVDVCRVTVHCTEADVAKQHVEKAKELGMTAMGVLMMTHMLEPEQLLEQARLFESYGADVVYMMDSAGHLLPEGVRARVGLLAEQLSIPVGFHAHACLGLQVSNTLAAIEEGASYIDCTMRGLGAGAGNMATELMAAITRRYGYDTNLDLYTAMDVAEDIVAPMMLRSPIIDKTALTIGYAGVYGSFDLHAKRAAAKYGLDPRDILIELGRRKVVGGQEDMIVQVAFEMAEAKKRGTC